MVNVVEVWKPVKGYEGIYEVSDHGRVKSLDRTVSCRNGRTLRIRGRIVRPWKNGAGYHQLRLMVDGNRGEGVQVHRLVMATFVGDPRDKFVNHKDGNKLNNMLSNLEYVTPKENTRHAYATGLLKNYGEGNGSAKLSEAHVVEILRSSERGSVLAKRFGVSQGAICLIRNGKTWSHLSGSKV